MNRTRTERQDSILRALAQRPYVRIAELSAQFGVSESAIRRDFESLAQRGIVKRTHGGAFAAAPLDAEFPYAVREKRNQAEKVRIGEAAAKLIGPGTAVILDAGTTTAEITRHLPDIWALTVVTNSLIAAYELLRHPSIGTILTGGNVGKFTYSMVGHVAEQMLRSIRVERAFISTGGLTLEQGLTNPNMYEIGVKRAMMASAKEVTVVADNSKLGHVALAPFATLREVHRVITDSGADPEIVERIRGLGVEVILA